MSATSHRKIGWLVQPLLALLTVGLAYPSGENGRRSGSKHVLTGHSALPPQSINKQTVGLALENRDAAASPVALAETNSVQPTQRRDCDWQKAREFQLPARLAVTAQMNRPKSRITRPKKTRTVISTGFMQRRSENELHNRRSRGRETATLLEFPMKQNAVGLPLVAAAA